MNSTKFDRTGTKNFMAELKAMTEELAAKHGVTLAKQSARYGGTDLSVSLKFETTSEDGTSDAAKARWDRTKYMEGLDPKMFGECFTNGTTTYEIVDLSPRSPKYPILAKSLSNGKVYKFQVGAVRNLLAKLEAK